MSGLCAHQNQEIISTLAFVYTVTLKQEKAFPETTAIIALNIIVFCNTCGHPCLHGYHIWRGVSTYFCMYHISYPTQCHHFVMPSNKQYGRAKNVCSDKQVLTRSHKLESRITRFLSTHPRPCPSTPSPPPLYSNT